jgi:uncharacterized membrane protein YphA (DoxX/SURF4 family)
MFRKLALALGAAAVLGAAALSPTTASAWGHGHWGHGHWGHGHGYGYGFGFYGPTYVAGPDCYLVRRQVQFADGSWHWRRFRVCN